MKNAKTDFPEDFFDWAYIPNFKGAIQSLASLAEPEDWQYQNIPHTFSSFPILENYVKYSYRKVAKERKIAFDKTDAMCCFNTGLVTGLQEPIFMQFKENTSSGDQYWIFSKCFRMGQPDAVNYVKLPEMAYYFDDPSRLVFDHRKELIVNYEHIIADNKTRFPLPYSTMNDYQVISFLKGAVHSTLERVRRNYKIAVPQYYNDSVQLLLPLCLSNPAKADLALVVEDFGTTYRAATCLSLDMALNNARQITKPDKEWLNP